MDCKFLNWGKNVKCVVTGAERSFEGKAIVVDVTYPELYNVIEPFDPYTHVFAIPRDILLKSGGFTCMPDNVYFKVDNIVEDESEIYPSIDSGWKVKSKEEYPICEGAVYALYHIENKNGAPVEAYAFICDSKYVYPYAGTANDGYEAANAIQTVEGQANAAIANGVDVLGATNADFFDMFGDGHPSGMCAKNGKIISRGPLDRPFFGIKKDGTPVITCDETDIDHAVSGYYVLLDKGNFGDLAIFEPFGNVCHPRTAVGICPDGRFIVLVVDGRLPDHSNGATLMDLALFFKGLGAVDALNLDGGGSSTFLVKKENGFDLLNTPADLVKPTEKLIRPIFNSILIAKRKTKLK